MIYVFLKMLYLESEFGLKNYRNWVVYEEDYQNPITKF